MKKKWWRCFQNTKNKEERWEIYSGVNTTNRIEASRLWSYIYHTLYQLFVHLTAGRWCRWFAAASCHGDWSFDSLCLCGIKQPFISSHWGLKRQRALVLNMSTDGTVFQTSRYTVGRHVCMLRFCSRSYDFFSRVNVFADSKTSILSLTINGTYSLWHMWELEDNWDLVLSTVFYCSWNISPCHHCHLPF